MKLKVVLAFLTILTLYNMIPFFKKWWSTTKLNTKFILFWIPMYDSKTFSFTSIGSELFQQCEFKNCYATHNRNKVPLQNFDAIIFHGPEFSSGRPQPWLRKSNQRYIYATMEAPINEYEQLEKFGSFYNWTMTYRFDSDIPWRYGYVVEKPTNYTMPTMEFINNKTRLVAWVVSHCHTWSRREIVYNNLLNFINIDVYGRCGNFTCPNDTATTHGPLSACYDSIVQNYKFYLSFENSYCTDYVTEKLYMLLERDIIPVVYGRFDYEKLLPPNSVIRADQFSSIKLLADYLIFLDKNPKEYLKYFEWKKNYSILLDGHVTACTLCKMLNDELEPTKTYTDLNTWWKGKNSSHCISSWKNLPRISFPL